MPGGPVYALRAAASGVKTAPLYGVPSVPVPETVNVMALVALQWPGVDEGVGVAAGVADTAGAAAGAHETLPTR